jgi:SpoVK/Ycf46/Vps4 family AAA+-type ATPase
MADMEVEFVHLARLALQGKHRDMVAMLRRDLSALAARRPDLAPESRQVLAMLAKGALSRGAQSPLPVDVDSKQELLRTELVERLDPEPVWPEAIQSELVAVVEERRHEQELRQAGLNPTRSILFVGAPGVGKTLAARWLASVLERPLFTLDLAAVMSSYLGRTGNNIRVVLEYAQKSPAVLLLDEFDSIAKRRDDEAEVGELKRLVTVLLQSVDEWPPHGLLIAATNHPELLDPAVWRRFERIVRFENPNYSEIHRLLEKKLEDNKNDGGIEWIIELLSASFVGYSYADINRFVTSALRESVIHKIKIIDSLVRLFDKLKADFDLDRRLLIAKVLIEKGYSQREISSLVGISRDTIRKHEVSESVNTESKLLRSKKVTKK